MGFDDALNRSIKKAINRNGSIKILRQRIKVIQKINNNRLGQEELNIIKRP